jgi:ABC-2 type transport system permease protein
MAEALGGDIEISLVENKEQKGDYTLSWTKYGGVDGYVVLESDTEIPLALATSMGQEKINLQSIQILLQISGSMSIHIFDAAVTETTLRGLDTKYGTEDAVVYFGVLAFRGEASEAQIAGASHTVNTRDMVAKGAYDKLMDNPIMEAFIGDTNIDIYSVKGFLCMELFSGLTLYIIIYFIIQYAGAFCSEMETKTIDILLSTPLSRRHLFISRYLSWVALNLILILCWILCIAVGVRAIGKGAEVPLIDVARTMILFMPFMLSVQSLCMLASVLTNESRKAYGICFGIYFGMYIFNIVGILSERLSLIKYFTLFHYWDTNLIFIEGIVPWGSLLLLTFVAVVLFAAGLLVFERKDLTT